MGDRFSGYMEKLHRKYLEISKQLADPQTVNNRSLFRTLSREMAFLQTIEDHYQRYSRMKRELEEAQSLAGSAEDRDMRELAHDEVETLERSLEQLKDQIIMAVMSDQESDNRNVFLEIRSGAGGDEASLFASDLLRMYSRMAEEMDWKAEVISTTYSSIGGIKEIILNVRGRDVYRFLQYESGVHRVQRVPVTESSGRIHTSTVTVAVLPEVDDVDVRVDPADLRIDTFSASGPGGQHVNKTQSAIRITHLPTGIVVTCQDEKSQHKNKDKALRVLKARLYEHEENKRRSTIADNRRSQVGSGERSEKIRTYNFPQNRVTDHRLEEDSNFNLEVFMDGNLVNLIEALSEQFSRTRIEERLQELISA